MGGKASNWIEGIWNDVRYAVRMQLQRPLFLLVAVLSIGLGIGANISVFQVFHELMARSLDVHDPDRLVTLAAGERDGRVNNPLWEYVRDRQTILAGIFAWNNWWFDITSGGESQWVAGLFVSGDCFRVLGVHAALGRVLRADDDRHGGGTQGPVAVVSYDYWQDRLRGRRDVIGHLISLDQQTFQIVGVIERNFSGLDPGYRFDVAIPIGCEALFRGSAGGSLTGSKEWLHVGGRLASGQTLAQAQAGLQVLLPRALKESLVQDSRPFRQAKYLQQSFTLESLANGGSETRRQYHVELLLLLAIAGSILMIGCANIANILLAKATHRQREIAIRVSLGASSLRIVRQLLTESFVMSILGALAVLCFVPSASRILIQLLGTQEHPILLKLAPDWHLVGFAIGITIFTAIACGLTPAVQAVRRDPQIALRKGSRGSISGHSRFSTSAFLIAGQIALSVAMLIGTAFFVRTLQKLNSVDAGFDRQNVLIAHVYIYSDRHPREQRASLYQAILERLRALPGAKAVAVSSDTPLSDDRWPSSEVDVQNGPEQSRLGQTVFFNYVSSQYFEVMRTALLAGRDFDGSDRESTPGVAIINETMARRYFGEPSPLGRVLSQKMPGGEFKARVIGVVGDARIMTLREGPPPTVFLAWSQADRTASNATFTIRVEGDFKPYLPLVTGAVAAVAPDLILEYSTLDHQVNDSLARERTLAILTPWLGILAIALVTIGVYGVVAHSVGQRKAEIGLRMALGATTANIVMMVLGEVLKIAMLGSLVGLACAALGFRWIASLLFGLGPRDDIVAAGAVLLVLVTTSLAAYLPAWRGGTRSPIAALREE